MRVIAGESPIDLEPFDWWDMFPPREGRIRLRSSSSPSLAAVGDYRVVLAFGPVVGFTMAWAIDGYSAMAIPFVERGISLNAGRVEHADRSDAEQAAIEMVDLEAGEVLVWCDALLVAVAHLTVGPATGSAAFDTRIETMGRELAVDHEPLERPTTTAENRDLYQAMLGMNLADHLLETMLFVLTLDDEELELSRNTVTDGDLRDLVRLYHLMPTWPQRCAVAYVLQDHDSAVLTDIRIELLGAPNPTHDLSICHIARATSLAWLRGTIDEVGVYLDDPGRLEAHAAIWASLQSD